MRELLILTLGLWLILLASSPVFAQNPVNPTSVTFDHADYAGTDSYVLGYFSSAAAAAPVQEANIPKPAAACPCSSVLVSRPSTFQVWFVGVRAVAGALTSPWSNLAPFVRSPVAPVVTAVK